MTNSSEDDVDFASNYYPGADMTPAEFEVFVAEFLKIGAPEVDGLEVQVLETIEGTDGTFTFDATARFQFAGMEFLVIAEAKLHRNPIKRDVLQILYSKMQSVGAHKGVVFSTAPFQSGALDFAKPTG